MKVFGPILHEVSSPASLNTSVKEFYDAVIAHSKPESVIQTFQGSWVDVRDLAEAHVRSFEREEASGKRFIVTSGNFVWQDWCKLLSGFLPPFFSTCADIHLLFFIVDVTNKLGIAGVSAPGGKPGSGATVEHTQIYDTTRAKTVLGLEFKGKEETARDSIASFKERGW